jgi:hypothetical protein
MISFFFGIFVVNCMSGIITLIPWVQKLATLASTEESAPHEIVTLIRFFGND